MGFHFRETMSGELTLDSDPFGAPGRAFSFRVTARCPRWGRYLDGGALELEGRVSIDGLASECALRGHLEIGLPLRKQLVYNFEFVGDDGARYRFHGQKDVSYLRLAHSMTTLRGALYRGDARLGSALLRFDLRDLPTFLANWRPYA